MISEGQGEGVICLSAKLHKDYLHLTKFGGDEKWAKEELNKILRGSRSLSFKLQNRVLILKENRPTTGKCFLCKCAMAATNIQK